MAYGSDAWDAATRRDLDIAYAEAARKRQNDQIAFENQQKNQTALSSLFANMGNGGGAPASGPNPFEAGMTQYSGMLKDLMTDPSKIQESAAYKFRVGQGQEALQRALGARGMLNSGNRLMELTKYGQDMASQEYDNQAGRLTNLTGMFGQNWNSRKSADDANALGWSSLNSRNALTLADMMQRNQNNTVPHRATGGMGVVGNLGGFGGDTGVDWGDFQKRATAQRDYLDRY